MVYLVTGEDSVERKKIIERFLATQSFGLSEILHLDDTTGELESIRSFSFNPLFGSAPAAVWAKYLIESYAGDEPLSEILNPLLESSTIFLFEERENSAALKKLAKQLNIRHDETVKKEKPKSSDVFVIANALAGSDRKRLWLTYQTLLAEHAPEAVFGIMLWKVRQLASKANNGRYLKLYRALLAAQAQSRKTKVPFEFALEKVLLTAEL